MTTPGLVLALTIGAASLALWTFVRGAARAPTGLGGSAFHVVTSLALVNLLSPVLMQPIVGNGESVTRTVLALFGVFLPALVYAFLSGLWALNLVARRLHAG